jgi:HAE1 family hydrophobic/amphiphilic exporter-1
MDIAKFAVTRPVAVTMRIASLVLLGAISFTRLPVDLLPNVSLPTVAVVTQWTNVAPEEIEAVVTRPIEESVSSAANLYQINSSTVQGISTVIVQFQWGTDVGQAAVDVLQLAERARQSFPVDPTLYSPVVYKFDPTLLPILVFGVSGESDPVKLRTLLDNQVTPIIESANGVASAVTTGGEQRAVIVNVDPDRLQAHMSSLNQVIQRIALENVNVPAGIAKQSDTEYTIRSLGWFSKPSQIANVPLGSFNGQNVDIGQVADVLDSHAETRLYTRLNNKPAVGIIIIKQSGANTISTAQAVFSKINQVQKMYPQLKFGLATDQSQFILNSVNDVRNNALIGGILAALILLFFLRNVRSTLVVATSIPISIISTFALLYVFGFTLNTMSLGAIALSTGLIVDDAVVVLENIFRHMERDRRTPTDAAIVGTNEIVSAVMASTWTVMVVFLPLFLIKGQAGQMYTQFALVVIFSIAVSLLDATTVVPMLATRLITRPPETEVPVAERRGMQGLGLRIFATFGRWFEVIENTYRHGLRWAIHHRPLTMGIAVLFTLICLPLVPFVGFELMPEADSGNFSGVIKLPIGTSLKTTDKTMQQVERIVRANPNVEEVFGAAGTTLNLRGATTALVPFQGSVTVRLKDNRKKSTVQVIADLRKSLAHVSSIRPLLTQVDIVSLLISGGVQNVEVDIFGPNLSTLSKSADQVISRIQGISGLQNIDVNWQEAMP